MIFKRFALLVPPAWLPPSPLTFGKQFRLALRYAEQHDSQLGIHGKIYQRISTWTERQLRDMLVHIFLIPVYAKADE
jgi:hypothetical protein